MSWSQDFSLRQCSNIPEESLCDIAANGSMKRLNISSMEQIRGPLLRKLATLCQNTLEKLDISFCRNIPENAIGLLADACFNLSSLTVFGVSQLTTRFVNGHRNDNMNLIGLGTPEIQSTIATDALEGTQD